VAETVVQSVRWTATDLELFPEDGKLREIVDGELFVSTQPHLGHQFSCAKVIYRLVSWNEEHRLGEVAVAPGVMFSPEDAVAPDVIWISHRRLAEAQDASGHLRLAPELVVEVLSPGATNHRRDREVKLKLYSQRGVREYWIVDWRSQLVEVYRREGIALVLAGTFFADDTLDSALLPGFRVLVRDLFANLASLPSEPAAEE
jgi:Uma2 family endonuclease